MERPQWLGQVGSTRRLKGEEHRQPAPKARNGGADARPYCGRDPWLLRTHGHRCIRGEDIRVRHPRCDAHRPTDRASHAATPNANSIAGHRARHPFAGNGSGAGGHWRHGCTCPGEIGGPWPDHGPNRGLEQGRPRRHGRSAGPSRRSGDRARQTRRAYRQPWGTTRHCSEHDRQDRDGCARGVRKTRSQGRGGGRVQHHRVDRGSVRPTAAKRRGRSVANNFDPREPRTRPSQGAKGRRDGGRDRPPDARARRVPGFCQRRTLYGGRP